MAVLLPLRIWKGETKVWKFTIWDDETDSRLNLDVYDDFEFQVKVATGDPDPALISKDTASGVDVLDQTPGADTEGQLTVTLTPPDTSELDPKVYQYDLWGIIGTERYLLSKPADLTVEDVVNGA